MNSPTIARGNNHSHPRECISHCGPRPAEGGIEIGPGRWICFYCWSRGLRSTGAYVRREEAASAAAVRRSEGVSTSAQAAEIRVDLVAKSLVETTAHDWRLADPGQSLAGKKQSQSVL